MHILQLALALMEVIFLAHRGSITHSILESKAEYAINVPNMKHSIAI